MYKKLQVRFYAYICNISQKYTRTKAEKFKFDKIVLLAHSLLAVYHFKRCVFQQEIETNIKLQYKAFPIWLYNGRNSTVRQ